MNSKPRTSIPKHFTRKVLVAKDITTLVKQQLTIYGISNTVLSSRFTIHYDEYLKLKDDEKI